MMLEKLRGRRGLALSLIGLLIVAGIVAFLFARMMMSYLGSSLKRSEQAAAQTGVAIGPSLGGGGSVAQAQGVLDWSRQEIQGAGQAGVDRAKVLTELNF